MVRETMRPSSQKPPYWVWKDGTEIEAGVGWITRLVGHAHNGMVAAGDALGQAEIALQYLERIAPNRISPAQAHAIRGARGRVETSRESLDALYRWLDATATLR